MGKKKHILFAHQNFPAQYKHLAPALSNRKNIEVSSLAITQRKIANINNYFYSLSTGNNDGTHRLALEFEAKMIRAESAAKRCIELREDGFEPDVVISHPGWGETLFIKEVWPKTKLLNYFEYYYHTNNSDVDFDNDPELHYEMGFDLYTKLIARNQPLLMSCLQSDAMISPTKFQADTAPNAFRDNIHVIHDGVDTDFLKPDDEAYITLSKESGLANEVTKLTKKDKIITFVNRNLEPYRGYHIFMRALPEILDKHPDAYILIVGEFGVSYGATPRDGISYKDKYLNEVRKDLKENIKRLRFLGRVDYNSLISMFRVSSAHIYLTYPFVLSWSMIEAMSVGSLVIGSDTEPVREVINNNKNGFLVDFHDPKNLAKKVIEVLDNKDEFDAIRSNARKSVIKNYDLNTICLPKQIELVESLL